MRNGLVYLSAASVLLAAGCGSGAATQTGSTSRTTSSAIPTANSRALVFNRSIGPVWLGETTTRVQYQWGLGKDDGGCPLMDESNGCPSAPGSYVMRYHVPGGYMRVGFYKFHVVDIETNSPHYKTTDGIGVGTRIPYASPKVMDGEKFRYFTPSCGCWWGWSAEPPPEPKSAYRATNPDKQAYRRWVRAMAHVSSTILTTDKGKVVYVFVARGDVSFQF